MCSRELERATTHLLVLEASFTRLGNRYRERIECFDCATHTDPSQRPLELLA
jgi:hypothetical protein